MTGQMHFIGTRKDILIYTECQQLTSGFCQVTGELSGRPITINLWNTLVRWSEYRREYCRLIISSVFLTRDWCQYDSCLMLSPWKFGMNSVFNIIPTFIPSMKLRILKTEYFYLYFFCFWIEVLLLWGGGAVSVYIWSHFLNMAYYLQFVLEWQLFPLWPFSWS